MSIALASPPPLKHSNPLAVMVSELLDERSKRAVYPPGETGFSLSRTVKFMRNARALLVDAYERFGPVFTLRLAHNQSVFMIGPEANHYMTVSNASNFTIRESHFRDVIAVVGDGVLTTDGDIHRAMRRIVLPAFHRESIASYSEIMLEEAQSALERITPGEVFDVNAWTRCLVLRVSMRALLGLDPDSERPEMSNVVSLLDKPSPAAGATRLIPGPLSPWGRLMRRLREFDRLIFTEISQRRAKGGGGTDVLSLLIDARDEDGDSLTDLQVRDQLMTLLLSGGETTTSSITFLLYELARHPDVADRIIAEQQAALDGPPRVEQLTGGDLVELEMALEETLRLFPAVWIGPRRAVETFEFNGVSVPAGAYVDYCPLASHYLPEVFPEPESFRPERFTPDAKAALPKGAYIPFGGGPRMCIGMRFAQLEIRMIVTLLLQRFELSLPDDFSLSVGQLPMLMPKKGLSLVARERTRRPEPRQSQAA
jgi:cytochrome P450